MKLYHGTDMVFDKIDLCKSKPNKDFGQGFYLSPDYDQALNMAKIKTEQQQAGEPVVMEFDVEEGDIKDLHTLVFDDYSEQWAEFILANRNNSTGAPVYDYDIVIGPIANDRVGVQLWKYENRLIDMPTLVSKLKYMKGLTVQYFFGTEKALAILKRVR